MSPLPTKTPDRQLPLEERPGDRFGPYELIRMLGRGGQGRVWLAQRAGAAPVALKLLDASHLARGGQRRFAREARVLARIDHPTVCPLVDSGVIGGIPFIALEYVEGESLLDALERERDAGDLYVDLIDLDGEDDTTRRQKPAMPSRDTVLKRCRLIEAVARGLHAVHETQVLHRDVKPANLLIRPDGTPVLVDFGIARDEDETGGEHTLAGEIFGTPAYMAPEQRGLLPDPVGPRSDIYALAVTLFEAITWKRPRREGVGVVLFEAHDVNPNVPRAVSAVLSQAFAPHPGARYATARDFADDLRRAVLGHRTCAGRGRVGRRLRPLARTPLLALFGFLCLLVGFLAGMRFSASEGESAPQAAAPCVVVTTDPTEHDPKSLRLAKCLELLRETPGDEHPAS